MDKAGKFLAILLRRWGSKTPKRAKTTSTIVAIGGTLAVVVLSIPTLGLPVWASISVGVVAATSIAYQQAKDESNETIIEETKKILQTKD